MTDVKKDRDVDADVPVTVGRIVMYVEPERQAPPVAAIVTGVVNGGPGIGIDSIVLTVFPPDRVPYAVSRALVDATRQRPGSWHWPVRA